MSGGQRESLAERVNATRGRAIVAYHFDRFARDLAATLDYLRRFARHGVDLNPPLVDCTVMNTSEPS